MSDRGRGRSNNGHGGRNTHGGKSFNGNSNGNKSTSKSSNKSLSDYIYYLGSAKQAADYETTTCLIRNHIKKAFNFGNDIAKALEGKN